MTGVVGLHHVQVACPPGGEDQARRFYGEGLGLTEAVKPAELAARGGAWFRAYAEGPDGEVTVVAEVHLGVEEAFQPARKAHPALLLDSVAALEETGRRLEALGFEVSWDERHTFAGRERLHAFDGHGNRVELLA